MDNDNLRIIYTNAFKQFNWPDEVAQEVIDAIFAADAMSDDDKQKLIDAYNEQQRTDLQAKIDQAQAVLDDATAKMTVLTAKMAEKTPVEQITK